MDGVPSRVQQSTYRRVVARPEPVQRKPEEAPPAKVEPNTVHRSVTSHSVAKAERSFKRFILPIVIVVAILAISIVGFFAWSNMSNNLGAAIDSSKYQAVFFTNGQVYFGKLSQLNDESMKLTDVYYLQAPAGEEVDPGNPQATATNQNNVQLIKLGDEIHGPQDEMIISRQQMLFYENLKSDGKVAQSIDKFKNNK